MTGDDTETVDELLTRELRDEHTSLEDATGREFDHHWLCTTSWKAGNFLRHAGVRGDVTVGVAGENPLALLAFFGTTLLEGTTRFDPPADCTDLEDFRALVAPVRDLEAGTYDLPRGAQRVGYGAKPAEPDIHHFDAGVWSENPAFPPLDIDPGRAILTDGEQTVTHGEVLEAARSVVEASGLEAGDRVVVRAPLSDVRTVAAGVLAPLLVDGVIVLTGDGGDGESEPDTSVDRGEYAVSSATGSESASVPEATRIELEDVSLP